MTDPPDFEPDDLPRCPACELTLLRTERDRAAGICSWCANPPKPDQIELAIGDVVLTGADAAGFLAAGRLDIDKS